MAKRKDVVAPIHSPCGFFIEKVNSYPYPVVSNPTLTKFTKSREFLNRIVNMDEILENYKRGKFNKCLELLKSYPDAEDIVDNLVIDNCKLVCEAFIRISENDPDKIYEMQEQLYFFYDRVISLGDVPGSNFAYLKLVTCYNFIHWLLFYIDNDIDDHDLNECFEIVSEGIARVLGKDKSSVSYSDPSYRVLDNLSILSDQLKQEHTFILLEFILTVILYVIKLKGVLICDCSKIIKKLSGLKEEFKGKTAVDEFLQVQYPKYPPLFKFSLDGTPKILELNEDVIDNLNLLESTFLYLQEDFTESLKSLQRNIHPNIPLWTYLVALNASELEKWELCLGFITKGESLMMQMNLKARFHLMKGRLKCRERNHMEAIRLFKEASTLCPKCPAVWYYIGQEYGRMGLCDSMLENFQKLVEVLTDDDIEVDLRRNFQTAMLELIHPYDEISEMEAYYALAVAYGLNENFKDAVEAFEKVLHFLPIEEGIKRKKIIKLPNHLTILHEAAIMNLQAGNLLRAELIAMDAIDQYTPEKPSKIEGNPFRKDAEWLERLIHQDLLESDLEPKNLPNEMIYSEDLIFGLTQNVIGMLILSEIQRIQDVDDYKQTLSSIFSTFSRYLASRRNDSQGGEELILVKALAGKTCLKVADVQMKGKDPSQVDKMFKRALSCNKGDKDALHGYYTFLTKAGRNAEALKLWKTFAKEKNKILVDSLSSFSLRYFLTDKITSREMERIQAQINFTDLKIS